MNDHDWVCVADSTCTSVDNKKRKDVTLAKVSLTEVAKIELQTTLNDGSANDGSGTGIQKGMLYGQTYQFKVTAYTLDAPTKLTDINWMLTYTSPENAQNKEINKSLATTGDTFQLKIDDKDMCGCSITIKAYILRPDQGASASVFAHNRYYWFDAVHLNEQISERIQEPWRVDQGGSSLCGMAALYYVMLKKQPSIYEAMAKELLRTGEYKIGEYTIQPNRSAAEKMYAINPQEQNYQYMGMFEVDWLVLATTRSGESNWGYDGIETSATDQLRAVNWPRMLSRLVKTVAGYKEVDSTGLTLIGLPVNKSPLGQLHDTMSNSDLQELVEIDQKFNQGKQILMMVDYQIIAGKTSYSESDLFTGTHWIVYEGGLRFEVDPGVATVDISNAKRVFFKAYTWGANPQNGFGHEYPDKTAYLVSAIPTFIKQGISTESFKSNYYGYIEAS